MTADPTQSDARVAHRRGAVVDDRILDATLAEIAASGGLDIKVDRVAERAGVNKTTVYRRHKTRDGLVAAAIDSLAEAAVPIPDTGDLRRDLTAMAVAVRANITSPLGRATLAASGGLRSQSAVWADLTTDFWHRRFAAAAAIIDRAAERGDCPRREDAEELIEIMVAPIHFRAHQVGVDVTDAFIELQVDRLLRELNRTVLRA